MSQPFAICYLHICKCCFKRRIFWTTSIDTKLNGAITFPHMEYPHLTIMNSIDR